MAGARSPELNGSIQREWWPRRPQCWTALPVSLEKASGLIVLCLRSFALQSPSAPHTRRHTDLHGCAHETCTLWHTHTDTHVHTQMQTHTHARPTHTHTRSSRAGGPAWAQQEGLALAPPSALGGLQRGWELQGHPGCAGREFTSGPAAQAFISLTVVSWVALVPGPQCPPVGRMACCLPSPQGCWCFGDSLPEKPAYTGESCEVTGAVLISHQNPRRRGGGGRGASGRDRDILACSLPPALPPAQQPGACPGPELIVQVPISTGLQGAPPPHLSACRLQQ